MFSDVTAEIFHVTPAAKLNDSPVTLVSSFEQQLYIHVAVSVVNNNNY